MGKLNQVIAVEKGVKSRAFSAISDLNKIAKKPDLFYGFSKVYIPKNEEDELLPGERKLVQFNVPDVLDNAATALSELIDITARKDYTNCSAFADVVIDGKVIVSQAPVTFLLFLEKQLTDFHTLACNIPVLDDADEWSYDENASLYRTAPAQTYRTKKTQKPLVLFPATDKHPAQCQIITEDVVVGSYNTTKQSGAIPKQDKADIIERTEKLLMAVKQAREAANMQDEEEIVMPSAAIFSYLLDDGE
jgi:hypothetical protein